MKRLLYSAVIIFMLSQNYSAQSSKLKSGPMIGYSTMTEINIWFQTITESEVFIKYWDIKNPKEKFQSEKIKTIDTNALTGKIVLPGLKPGTKYEFDTFVDGAREEFDYQPRFQTQTLWQWRRDPPDIKFAAGSCAYINEPEVDRPNNPYGGGYQIFNSIAGKQPDFMLWLGDNLYFREVDWNSWSGIIHRYTHDRATPELQKLFATAHNYAIWDDHDFGPNNSDRGLWNKDMTLKAFKMFWTNPSYGVNRKPGITTYFEWADCAFFLLDDRYYRTPDRRKTGRREMLGRNQIEWLIDALVSSRAPFKFIAVGSQVFNPTANGENYISFKEERNYLLELIEKENIPGVIFLSGDIHRSELNKFERKDNYPLYEFTISPLTSGVSTYIDTLNYFRVNGTLTYKRNFGVFKITGPRKKRVLKFTDYDSDGKELWHYSIKAEDLRKKRKVKNER